MAATITERFQIMAENHGPLESPIAHRLLANIMEESINRFHSQPDGNLADFVVTRMKNRAADILIILELAADWSNDPVKAAGRLLRPEIEADAQRRAEALDREKQSAIEAAVQVEADKFKASLKKKGTSEAAGAKG